MTCWTRGIPVKRRPNRAVFPFFLCVLGVLCGSILFGCGTDLDAILAGINPLGATTVSLDVKAACEGVLTEEEMQTGILAARIDQLNGYTKSEELATVTTNCALDAALGGVSADDCTACKSAILDQVYGQ